MRPIFFLREAMRALKRNAIPSFAAMATVLVTVLVLGVFIPVVQATTGAANEVRDKVIADVYLKADVKKARHRPRRAPAEGRAAGRQASSSSPRNRRTRPRASATRRRTSCSAPTRCRTRSASRRASRTTSASSRTRSRRRRPGGGTTVVDPAIDEVRNREEDTNKILSVTRVVKITMALLLGLLGIASMLLIANTIRLSLYARRREVEVMKLVGATDWFIRWPFVLEGVIVGALGGLLAVLLLAVAKIAVVDPLAADFALIAAPDTIDFRLLIGILLAAGDRGLRARLGPQPAEVPPRLATRTATSSRRSPARAAARSTRAAIPAASSPAAARSSSSSPPRPYASPVVRASVTPSVNSTSDSRGASSKSTSSSFGSSTQPSTEPGRPTCSIVPEPRMTIGIGCPAQQIVARVGPVELDAGRTRPCSSGRVSVRSAISVRLTTSSTRLGCPRSAPPCVPCGGPATSARRRARPCR